MAAGAVVAHPADKYANATQPWMRYQPRVDTLTAYKPTMTQRIPDMVKDGLRALGLNKFAANAFGSPIADVLGYSPVGAVAQSWDAGQAAARAPGMFGKARGLGGGMALAALGAVPGGKALAGKAERELLKRLPPSASLAGIPLPEDAFLARMARREQVPLEQARSSQNWMDWERFKSGEHPGAMFKGFEDAPVAVRREDGEFVILDGHHRTTAALNRGDKNMDMYVVNARDYAPEVMGRAPSKNNGPNTDDLLAELLGISPAPLAMDEASRMARAAEQGFTVDAYHGTEAPDFQQFLPEFSDTARKTGTPHGAFVFSDSPHNASGYAGKPSGLGYDIANFDNGGRVIPAKIALGRTMKVNAKGDNWRDIYHKGESYDINELAQIAQAKGYDSLTVKNVVDSNGYTKKPQTTHFVFNPANIRSKFAAFDPAKRGSANLLAGLGLGGLGYGMVSGSSTDWGDPTQY